MSKCDVCLEGKLKRLPLKTSESHASNVLELVHSDIMGPIPVQSIGGSKYIITFLDDYSRYAEMKPIKRKNEAVSEFKN